MGRGEDASFIFHFPFSIFHFPFLIFSFDILFDEPLRSGGKYFCEMLCSIGVNAQ